MRRYTTLSRIVTLCIVTLAIGLSASAEGMPEPKSTTVYPVRKISQGAQAPEFAEKVIVKGDTLPLVLPERNFGRFDRGLFNYLFLPKGQWMGGMTASYADFDASNVQILDWLKDFDFKGEIYSIRPYAAYVFSNNNVVGVKFSYDHASAVLGNLSLDMGDDLNFSIKDVSYKSNSYGGSVFYRHYIGLNRSKRFGVFNEVDLGVSGGKSEFHRVIGGVAHDTKATTTSAALNFSPGVTVFMLENVSFNLSFGVFGLHMTHEKQVTDGVEKGSQFSSGANFRFNIFNINFGLGVHI